MLNLRWIFPDRQSEARRTTEDRLYWEPYRRAAAQEGLRLTVHPPEHVAVDLGVAGTGPRVTVAGERVDPYDTMFLTELYSLPHHLQDVPAQVSLFTVLEHAGFHLPIPVPVTLLANDKMATALRLADAGVPVVPTVRLVAGRDCRDLDLDAVVATTGLPAIVKPAGWGGGAGVCLVRTVADLRAVLGLAAAGDTAMVCQPFLGPATADLRIYTVDGRAHTVMLRRPQSGQHVANVAQGGAAEVVELPGELAPAVARITASIPTPYLCIDLLHDGQQYWLSEIEPDGANGWMGEETTGRLLGARFSAYARAHTRWRSARRLGEEVA